MTAPYDLPPAENPFVAPASYAYLPSQMSGVGSRPTSVTVIAILGLVFGILGFLLYGWSAGVISYLISTMDRQMSPIPPQFVSQLIQAAVSVVGCIFLVVLSAGLLKLKPWARTGILGYAIYSIGFTLATPILNDSWGQFMELAEGDTAMIAGGLLGMGFVLLLSCSYPAAILFFMTRPHAKRAFAARSPENDTVAASI